MRSVCVSSRLLVVLENRGRANIDVGEGGLEGEAGESGSSIFKGMLKCCARRCDGNTRVMKFKEGGDTLISLSDSASVGVTRGNCGRNHDLRCAFFITKGKKCPFYI